MGEFIEIRVLSLELFMTNAIRLSIEILFIFAIAVLRKWGRS